MKKVIGNILLAILVIIIILVIIMLPWIISLFNLDCNFYSVLMSYLGAIIGGFLTLIGVYITIIHSKKEKINELELQYSPVLLLDVVENINYVGEQRELNILFNSQKFDDSNLMYGNSLLKISNVGRGEAKDIIIDVRNIEIVSSSIKFNNEDISSYLLIQDNIQFIPINGSLYIHIGIPSVIENKDLSMILKITLDIEFMGIMNKKKYDYELNFCLSLQSTKENYIYDIYSTHLFLK